MVKIVVGILALILFSSLAEGQTFNERSYLESLNRHLCNNVANGEPCKEIANLASGVSAICCQGECRINAKTCRDAEWVNILEVIKTYSCINIENGRACNLPDSIKKSGITGTCHEGKCHIERKADTPPTSNMPNDGSTPIKDPIDGQWDKIGGIIFLLMSIVLIVAVLSIVLLVYKKRGGDGIPEGSASDSKKEIKMLQREKEEIEHMIKIAKVKFHQRELDEESFREIVRDHQKKLIEIETKMDEIECRIRKLEKKKTTS